MAGGLLSRMIIKDIEPKMGLPGGIVKISGKRFLPWDMEHEHLNFTNANAWIDAISESTVLTTVPEDSITGDVYIDTGKNKSNKFKFIVPEAIASGLHLVDSPIVDNDGNIFATYSGSRGETTPVSIYKISKDKKKEIYISEITNATSLAIGNDGALYIASRFDGKIYRSTEKNHCEIFCQGLGTAFGLARNPQGELFVGDRSGSIFKIDSDGQASFYTSIPQSYIAFHLNFDTKGNLFVTNPVHMGENIIWKIDKENQKIENYYSGLSLFHGFVFDSKDNLYLAETKRNESRIIKIQNGQYISTVITGTNFIGLAFDKNENLIVATANSLYLIEKGYY